MKSTTHEFIGPLSFTRRMPAQAQPPKVTIATIQACPGSVRGHIRKYIALASSALALAWVLCVPKAVAFEPTLEIFIETPLEPKIQGITNLPDGTELLISISRTASAYLAQDSVTVVNGRFHTGQFSAGGRPLNPGSYKIEVVMPVPAVQPQPVQSVVGSRGELMTGKLVRPDPFGTGQQVWYAVSKELGGPPDAKLDAESRALSKAEFQRWIVQTCMDVADAGPGPAEESTDRNRRVDECIRKVNGPDYR
jgi:hypothetical protein